MQEIALVMPHPGQGTPNKVRIRQMDRRDSIQEVGTTIKARGKRIYNPTFPSDVSDVLCISF